MGGLINFPIGKATTNYLKKGGGEVKWRDPGLHCAYPGISPSQESAQNAAKARMYILVKGWSCKQNGRNSIFVGQSCNIYSSDILIIRN